MYAIDIVFDMTDIWYKLIVKLRKL
jgi:hypothetical protein